MAFILADRVFETTTTTGTGTVNLDGAATGFQTFVAGVGDGNETYYVLEDGTDWEVGIGTVTSGSPNTLSRDTVLQSSNSDAAINWGSGTRNVFVSMPADKQPIVDKANTFSADNTFSGNATFTAEVLFPDDGERAISSGAITVTGVYHTVRGEGAAADDLATISGGSDGQLVIIRADVEDITIVTTGNIDTQDGNSITLTAANNQRAVLIYDGTLSAWQVIASPVTVVDASTTEKGIVEKATQAEVEAETADKYADAADMKYHPGIAKFWIMFDTSSTTPTDLASHNVTSITDDGAGLYQLNLSITFSSANYGISHMCTDSTGVANNAMLNLKEDDKPTATTVPLQLVAGNAGSIGDAGLCSVTGHGDL